MPYGKFVKSGDKVKVYRPGGELAFTSHSPSKAAAHRTAGIREAADTGRLRVKSPGRHHSPDETGEDVRRSASDRKQQGTYRGSGHTKMPRRPHPINRSEDIPARGHKFSGSRKNTGVMTGTGGNALGHLLNQSFAEGHDPEAHVKVARKRLAGGLKQATRRSSTGGPNFENKMFSDNGTDRLNKGRKEYRS